MDEALNAKRKKFHVYTLVLQLAVAFSSLVAFNLVKSSQIGIPMGLMVGVHVLLLIVLHVLVLITVGLYFKSKIFKVGYGLLIFSGFMINFVTGSPELIHHEWVSKLNAISLCMVLSGQTIWFIVIVRDIFMEQHDLTYRILGAANIYWLMIVIFAYIYGLFEISFPGSMGVVGLPRHELIGSTYKLSLHSTVSIDHPFTGVALSLENLCLMQSAVAHLFIVFLVGRLLTK